MISEQAIEQSAVLSRLTITLQRAFGLGLQGGPLQERHAADSRILTLRPRPGNFSAIPPAPIAQKALARYIVKHVRGI
jgi:hypothetical protein